MLNIRFKHLDAYQTSEELLLEVFLQCIFYIPHSQALLDLDS